MTCHISSPYGVVPCILSSEEVGELPAIPIWTLPCFSRVIISLTVFARVIFRSELIDLA